MGMPKFEELLPLRLEDMARTPKKKRGISQKESSPAWDTRQFAAATTTPERLEPDPACVCPAPAIKSDSILKASAAREAEAALLALAHEVAQAGAMRTMNATRASANRRRIRAKDRFIAWKSKRQDWCRLMRDEHSPNW